MPSYQQIRDLLIERIDRQKQTVGVVAGVIDTGGFRSFLGFDRESGTGVVTLSNAGTAAGVDDIAQHLLTG